jgi:hypothetical protein
LLMMLCLVSCLSFRFIIEYFSRRFNNGSNECNMVLENIQTPIPNSTPSLRSPQSTPPLAHIDSSLSSAATNTQTFTLREQLSLFLIFSLNILMVGTVNGLYILSTLQNHFRSSRLLIQLSVSLFGMIWDAVLKLLFPHRLRHSFSVVWLLSVVGVINWVIIPCVVITLTSPS